MKERNNHSFGTRLVDSESAAYGMYNWVQYTAEISQDCKRALAEYAATHLVNFGMVIQVGSGTTFNYLMDEVIERQKCQKQALNLMVLTTNLIVLEKGMAAQKEHPDIFNTMQLILTGGSPQLSLHSVSGEFAAEGVANDIIHPDTIFFGAAGLCFDRGDIEITYQFQDELSTQVAYATRPAEHRVLLCDHTKLGKKSAWKAKLTLESVLSKSDRFSIVSTMPDDADPSMEMIKAQVNGFKTIVSALDKATWASKVIELRFVDKKGAVKLEVSWPKDFLNSKSTTDTLPDQSPPGASQEIAATNAAQ